VPVALGPDGVDLLRRAAFGQHLVDPDDRAHRLGHVGAVPGHHDHPLHPAPAEAADGAGRVGTNGVVEDDGSDRRTVDPDEHGEGSVQVGPAAHGVSPGGRSAGEYPLGVAHLDQAPLDLAGDPLAGAFVDRRGQRQRQATTPSRPDHRGGQDVGRDLVERGSQAEDLVGADGPGVHRHDLGDRRSAPGEGPGLVEEQDLCVRQALQRGSTLDHHPPLRRPGEARDDGHRSGQDEGARGGHHQDRHRPLRVAREQPGHAGDGEADDEEG